MDRVSGAGLLLLVTGSVGYVAGVAAPYPGRELSILGVMTGLTLAAIGWSP